MCAKPSERRIVEIPKRIEAELERAPLIIPKRIKPELERVPLIRRGCTGQYDVRLEFNDDVMMSARRADNQSIIMG